MTISKLNNGLEFTIILLKEKWPSDVKEPSVIGRCELLRSSMTILNPSLKLPSTQNNIVSCSSQQRILISNNSISCILCELFLLSFRSSSQIQLGSTAPSHQSYNRCCLPSFGYFRTLFQICYLSTVFDQSAYHIQPICFRWHQSSDTSSSSISAGFHSLPLGTERSIFIDVFRVTFWTVW